MTTRFPVSNGAARLFRQIHTLIHKGRNRECVASQAALARMLKTSLRSVQRWTAELVDGGYIIHSYGQQKRARYDILKDLAAQMAGQVAPQMAGQSDPILISTPSEKNSLREYELPSEESIKKAALDATDQLASKNLKSKIAQMLRSSNAMPTSKLPPVSEKLRREIRHASGDYR